MFQLISDMFRVLNIAKDFIAGYSGDDACGGHMMIIYKGTRCAVKIIEMSEEDQALSDHDALDKVPGYFKEEN